MEEVEYVNITVENWNELEHSRPWPRVHGFWLKKLTGLHSRLQEYLQDYVCQGHIPEWMESGRIVLMQDVDKGAQANNYRSISYMAAYDA